MTPIRILLAEDHEIVRAALVALIELEDDLQVVGQVGRGDDAVAMAVALEPDVALLDVDMPGGDGVQVTAELGRRVPRCRSLVLTALNKPGVLQRALRAGATGFVVKHAPADELLSAIRAIAAGQRVVSPSLAVAVLAGDAIPLTDREVDVVRLLAAGASAHEIARRLRLTEGTVRNYTSNMMTKTGARNRVDLVRIAGEQGWF